MRIGDKSNSLQLERVEATPPVVAWRCEATALTGGWKFAAVHDQVLVNSLEEVFQQLVDFSILQIPRVEIVLSEGGWLRIKRDMRGQVIVRYRLARLSIGAAVEGEVILDHERGDKFCKELSGLLSMNPAASKL